MSMLKLLKAVRAVNKADSLSAEDILVLQQERFRKLLKHTFGNSDFYRKYYLDHGIKEEDLNEIQPEDLPVIDKNIMMENYDEFVTDPALKQEDLERFITENPVPGSKYKKKYSVVHTSGSSGTIGLYAYGPDDWAFSKALALRSTGVSMPWFRRKRVSFIAAVDGHFASVASFYNLPRAVFRGLPLSISSPIDEICEKINRFQPDLITGYASGLNLLAEEQLKGNIKINPSEAFCTGDPLIPAYRERVNEAFGVNPVNMYGSSETMTLSGECHSHHRLHLYNDWFSVQVVNEELKPASAGRVIITNLYNFTQPLIRYQMNDEVVLSDKPCSCGLPFPVIESIVGRQEEFLWFSKSNGEKDFIHPIVLAEFFAPGLEKFQFTQAAADKLVMHAVICGDREKALAEIRKKMTEIFSGKSLQEDVQFEIEVVDELRNDPKTGKFRLINPLKVN